MLSCLSHIHTNRSQHWSSTKWWDVSWKRFSITTCPLDLPVKYTCLTHKYSPPFCLVLLIVHLKIPHVSVGFHHIKPHIYSQNHYCRHLQKDAEKMKTELFVGFKSGEVIRYVFKVCNQSIEFAPVFLVNFNALPLFSYHGGACVCFCISMSFFLFCFILFFLFFLLFSLILSVIFFCSH